MAGVCKGVLTALKATKSFVYDNVKEYLGYVGSCEDNLGALRKSLSEVCDKKDDINKKVKDGEGRLEEITREARSWLKVVRILTEDEELKCLMYKDIESAKFVVKMMEKRELKRRIREDSGMQELAIKVMNKLKEEMYMSDEGMRKIVEEDYKRVGEVMVEVMKDTIEEFKKLLKEDKNMAIIATRMLKDKDLDKLTKDDEEMMKIVREAENTIDKELRPNCEDGESSAAQPLLVKIPEMSVSGNIVKEAAKKLFTHLVYLVTPLGKLMDDDDFKKAVPHAVDVKLGLEVVDGLLIRDRGSKKEMDDPTNEDSRGCCCSPLSLCSYYQGRFQISKAAESMVKHVQNELIGKCSQDRVTAPKSAQDLKPIPSQFLKGLDSRSQLLRQILEKLSDDQVDSVGLFGMGGIGKTTLAKEVSNSVKGTCTIKVMVEISSAPDIVRIQAAIAESVDLPLRDVSDVGLRATRLYNRLVKEKKILIILDNVWEKLNLDEIGIPNTCKLLFTARDRDVCRVMDVRDVNILEVGVMNTNEARELFKSQARNQADVPEYRDLVERFLSKCGGLPLAVVALANFLKDKDLSRWVKVADDLEKPPSSQMSGYYGRTFMIFNTSYEFIQPKGKRIFFLLISLFPPGSSVSIESLMRYVMGLNLFDEHVNKLSEAIDEAVTWANELLLASMLLEGDVKGDVKIHDIVRDFAISCAAKEEKHKFMVEAVSPWLDIKTLNKYTALSLTSKNDYSRLSGVKACRLQILILKGDLSPNFGGDFFSGMVNLKVLALSNMDFKPTLPGSVPKLKKLRMLCIEGCKLGNFELVGELVNLLVLSLRGSSMENIPNKIGNLRKLRLLDLGGCISSKLPLIPTYVLNKLSRLEGLYMYNEKELVLGEYEAANGMENIRLPYLNALEIKVWRTEELPFDSQSIKKLDKFRISYRCNTGRREEHQMYYRILNLAHIVDVSEFLKTSGLEVLLKKVDFLEILACSKFEDVFPLDQEGCRSLRSLRLFNCDDMKCIVDGRTVNNMIVFPCLQSLELDSLNSLEMVCNANVSPGSFYNLQIIKLSYLDELRSGLPLVPRTLKEIEVFLCGKLEFIFIEDEEVLAIELPFLKTLVLKRLDSLLSLVGPKEFSNSYDALQEPQPFFGGKIGLPSLELFKLELCSNVGKLWSKEIHTPAFQNLKTIQINACEKLSCVGSPSVFSNLVQLEDLSISYCKEMHEVISHEEIEESEIGDHIIVFPQLKSLSLERLHNLESFYGGRSKPVFPKLKRLNLDYLKSMKMFAKLENSSALFEKIDFPCLEELKLTSVNDEVTELWDNQSLTTTSNPAPMLSQLELGNSILLTEVELVSLAGLRHISFPSIVLENISFLTLENFYLPDGNAVFSSSNLGEKCGVVWTYSELPNVEKLRVWNSRALDELFEKEENNSVNDALTSFCGQVKTLELGELPTLNVIPLHLFKSIVSLTLFRLKWNCLISADVLNSLHQLQFLSIQRCRNMEALVINIGLQINLPSLKHLDLHELDSFIGISSMPKHEAALVVPSLETLVIHTCSKLEHFWQGSIFAPRLQDVSIMYADNLKQFFVGKLEDKIELPSLRKVSFWHCDNVKCISTGSLTAPKLREVELSYCSIMESFFPENQNDDGDLQLPSLEVVRIFRCYKLHAFSLGRVVAPKLTQISYDLKDYPMLPYDDLNHFLKENNL